MKSQIKESNDEFRNIVRQYIKLYRDSEESRIAKEEYFKWLQSHADKLTPSLKSHIERKVKEKAKSKTEATTSSAVPGVMTPFAFSTRGIGNVRAAKSSTGFTLAKPVSKSPENKLAIENQMYSEPSYVNPAQNIEPVDTYEDENGLIQHGDPEMDPALAGHEQGQLPMYEEKMNNWYNKVHQVIEGINGLKYSLKTEADASPSVPPSGKPAVDPQPSTSAPQQPRPDLTYNVQSDFTGFDTKLKNSTEQLKTNLQKSIQDKILNKKVVIRASKGIKQPESDYTVNVTGVNIDYFYDRYVIVVIGREENKKKTSKFLLNSGYKIKVLGGADIRAKDKSKIEKSKALTAQADTGVSNVVTSKEPLPTKPQPKPAEVPPTAKTGSTGAASGTLPPPSSDKTK